jgi:hypothetical protein
VTVARGVRTAVHVARGAIIIPLALAQAGGIIAGAERGTTRTFFVLALIAVISEVTVALTNQIAAACSRTVCGRIAVHAAILVLFVSNNQYYSWK